MATLFNRNGQPQNTNYNIHNLDGAPKVLLQSKNLNKVLYTYPKVNCTEFSHASAKHFSVSGV